jgi:hypothetical protein
MTSEAEAAVSTSRLVNKVQVHWSRIVHLADNRGSSELAGSPRLKAAYNRIQDLLKVLGGSSEMFWKGGFPGISFEVQPGMEDVEFDVDEFKEEVESYANGLQRYLRLIGVKAVSLAPQVADPTPQIHAGLDQICITINCPKRIFLGTESAHLASTQDQKTWADRINGRRMQYAVPYLLRPFLYRLIAIGQLPVPEAKLQYDWKDAEEVDPLVRAQAFEKMVNGMAQYVSSGLATLITPMFFLTEIVRVPIELAQKILEAAKEQVKDTEKLPLVQATDEMTMQKQAMEQKAESDKAALALKATEKPGSAGTNTPGKSGRKPGTGKRREITDTSVGNKGG